MTGTVESINKDIVDDVYILIAGRDFSNVHASLAKSEEAKAGQLSKGDRIAVLCEGAGMIIQDPILKDCLLQ